MLQEVAAGQYLGSGGSTLIGQFVPMLKGVGYATMTIVFFLDIYYCIIIAWTLFYLINSFVSLPDLPWATCGMFRLQISLTYKACWFCSNYKYHIEENYLFALRILGNFVVFRQLVEHAKVLRPRTQQFGGVHQVPQGAQRHQDSRGGILGVSMRTNEWSIRI